MELIYELLGILLIGGIIIWMFITAIQELNFKKEIHDKEMEELNLKILKVQQEITLHKIKANRKVLIYCPFKKIKKLKCQDNIQMK